MTKTVTPLCAIIPARGGSKGLPRKNVLPLAGIPLVAHSILSALEADSVGRIILSTEDSEIAQIGHNYHAEVIARPAELATDHAQTHDVVAHVLETLRERGELPQHFVLLQPTSPLRTASQIDGAAACYFSGNASSVMSVAICGHHPMKAMGIENGCLQALLSPRYLEMRRQDLPEAYDMNGAIYILSSFLFLEKRTFFVPPAMPYIMEATDSVDIDTELDLHFAEYLLARRKGRGV
jgi:CMP-N,N'-diacetyllegionaminic acid synthase